MAAGAAARRRVRNRCVWRRRWCARDRVERVGLEGARRLRVRVSVVELARRRQLRGVGSVLRLREVLRSRGALRALAVEEEGGAAEETAEATGKQVSISSH
jgi:hypothetical protein